MCLHISLTCFMCQCRINNTSKGIYIEKKENPNIQEEKQRFILFFCSIFFLISICIFTILNIWSIWSIFMILCWGGL